MYYIHSLNTYLHSQSHSFIHVQSQLNSNSYTNVHFYCDFNCSERKQKYSRPLNEFNLIYSLETDFKYVWNNENGVATT